ncbi:30S ribosomal protein S12 methylthiotransferase RimO [Candidatus Sumerlaeota bacterium]|nr:30S ribosomal protein S12 methylthiotransferase RimO [Candidatus Sumerlaeota bacterium]
MRVGVVTLGCDKNTVDNEYLAGLLTRQGVECIAVNKPEDNADNTLDAVVITTCAFTEEAREENIGRIVEWAEAKQESARLKRLYLSGCLTQRYADELIREFPEIDGLVGVGQWTQLAAMITADAPERTHPQPDRSVVLVDLKEQLPRAPLDNRPYAYLKISDGCNHQCTFCSIPLMKGRMSSVPREIVLHEARGLIERGAREINIVAQDSGDYGRDRYEDYRLDRLVEDLIALDGDFRVRLLYCYPMGVTERLIELLAGHPKVCNYLDMPLQHLDREVLRRMKRPHSEMHAEELIGRLRERAPEIALRTTFITGFPGETDAAFENLLEGVRRIQFDWLGAFTFSREEGTPSAEMPDQIPDALKQERYERLMIEQQSITEAKLRARVGSVERVLIEAQAEEPENCYAGRSEKEAPEVDGLIFVESEKKLTPGAIVSAQIINSGPYDLFASMK